MLATNPLQTLFILSSLDFDQLMRIFSLHTDSFSDKEDTCTCKLASGARRRPLSLPPPSPFPSNSHNLLSFSLFLKGKYHGFFFTSFVKNSEIKPSVIATK